MARTELIREGGHYWLAEGETEPRRQRIAKALGVHNRCAISVTILNIQTGAITNPGGTFGASLLLESVSETELGEIKLRLASQLTRF